MGVYKDLKAKNKDLEKLVRELSAVNTELTIELDRERSNNDAYRIARKDDKLRIEALEVMLNKRRVPPPVEHELIPLQLIRAVYKSDSHKEDKNGDGEDFIRRFIF